LAERTKPAEFAALIQRFYGAATRALARSDAVIEKLVGDAVIAIYGAGISRPDHRRQAFLGGLALLRAMGHSDPNGPWLPIGVGVHAGPAFVGSIAGHDNAYEFAALGATMNLAARLAAPAHAGELLATDAV